MSKCIECGRELTSGEPIEMYHGRCANCDWQKYISARIIAMDDVQDVIAYGTFGRFKMLSEEEFNNLQTEIDQLKQQIEKVQQENKILKDIRFLERVVPANSQLHQLSNRECYLKGYDNAISETIRVFEESYGKDKVKLITERNELLMDIEKVGGYKSQIEELKQQLEESFTEEDVEGLIEDRNKTIKFLQQQLAEKDCRIEELEGQFAYECECNKQLVELQKQLAEKDKEIKSLIVDYEKRISQEQELMSNMEHQLAEKQNTIDEINKEFVQAVHDWKALCAEKDEEIETMKKDSDKNIDYLVEFASLIENEKDCNRMLKALDRVKSGNKYIVDKANQSKTEFAIQELEKVKELVKDKSAWQSPFGLLKIQESDVEQIIDQQINDLRGE